MPQARGVELVHSRQGSSVLTVILPGFNQDGNELRGILTQGLQGSDVATYKPSRRGADQRDIVHVLTIARTYRHLVIYAESHGALDAAALLRAYPDLTVDQMILNGGMSGWQDANTGRLVRLSQFVPSPFVPGSLLHYNQRDLSGRQFARELRRLTGTPAVKDREFAGRVGGLTYMGAPGKHYELAEKDPFIRPLQACTSWFRAVDFEGTVAQPATWANRHAPTRQQPGAVIKELRIAINRALAS